MNVALAQAARHDEAGRHDDAINALARGTQEGNLEAMTELAKRLVVGDRAPLLPKDGARFLVDAAHAGHAEAAVRLATLTALGAHVPQSWSDTLGLLVLAADRGSGSAQGQLETLAGRTVDERDGDRRWRRLAESVDVRFWATAPPGTTLSPHPPVRMYQEFVTDPVCEWLIEQARPRLGRALIYDPAGGDVADHMRTNSAASFDLMTADVVHAAVQTRIAAAIGLPVQHLEAATVLHYSPGEQITDHYDFVNPRMPGYATEIAERGQRIATFLVYLNDDYEGGETDFPQLGLRYHGGKRGALFFANALPNGEPDLRMVHAGLPPKNNEKWLLSQFVRNRPVSGIRAEKQG
jgi:prolyl 4-hydroxylase